MIDIILTIVAFTLEAWEERNAYHLALVGMLVALLFMAGVQMAYIWEVNFG